MQYKQFILAEMLNDTLRDQVVKDVVDNIHASLAADDDPSNDNTPVELTGEFGVDASGRRGLWIIGTADAEPQPYPQPAGRADFEVAGAVKTVSDQHEPTDFDIDSDAFFEHLEDKARREPN